MPPAKGPRRSRRGEDGCSRLQILLSTPHRAVGLKLVPTQYTTGWWGLSSSQGKAEQGANKRRAHWMGIGCG